MAMEPVYGPYQTERDAHDAVITLAGPGDPPMPSVLSQRQKWQLLGDACAVAQLRLGEHDRRVLRWLAEYEDSTVAVIAGLIVRAGQRARQRREDPRPDGHALAYCPECECPSAFCGMSGGQPAWQCPTCYHVFTLDPVMLEWLGA
jgi:hypothetical protein